MKRKAVFLAAHAAALVVLSAFLMAASRLPAPAHTGVSGAIATDTAWTLGGSPYLIQGDVTVNPGVRLTISPGVQVKFDGLYSLIVRGTLVADGSLTDQIVFTSNQASPAAGDWGTIDLRSDSANSSLTYAIIEYGGNDAKRGFECAGGELCIHTSSLALENTALRYSATRGAVLSQSSASLLNNAFIDNVDEGILLDRCVYTTGACLPSILGNTFTGNHAAIRQNGPFDPRLGGNSASGNDLNGYALGWNCDFAGDVTLEGDDLPYVVDELCSARDYYGNPISMTVQAGAIFKLQAPLIFEMYNLKLWLNVAGTEEKPVIFTSLKDDSLGGDTNNDGSDTAPAREDWGDVRITGSDVNAVFKHAIFRYGGNTGLGTGPLLYIDSTGAASQLHVQHGDFSQAEVGINAGNTSDLLVEDSWFHELANYGMILNSAGDILVQRNLFEGIGLEAAYYIGGGINAAKGTPVIRDNTFKNNRQGVYANSYATGLPVVSPHNRFLDHTQNAIQNNYPSEGCIDATQNWWGSASGPADSSSAQDACGLEDNPSIGAAVSNGVNYSPWEGGVARPLIARPGCGVTADDTPTIRGRSQAGATISFYDAKTLLGVTTAAADHSFTWTPTTPLANGAHTLTAQASLSGQTSLPSKALNLEVDNTLDFDPAGVAISYTFHNVEYTQMLKDASGCASPTGDLSTPLWLRPGTNVSVEVPVSESYFSSASRQRYVLPDDLDLHFSQTDTAAPSASFMVTVTNRTGGPIRGYKSAAVDGNPGNRVYGAYGQTVAFPSPIPPGDTYSFAVDSQRDLAFVDDRNRLVHRADVKPGASALLTPTAGPQVVAINNNSGRTFNTVYFAGLAGDIGESDHIGGQIISAANALASGGERSYNLPPGTYDMIAIDDQGGYHIRQVKVDGGGGSPIAVNFAVTQTTAIEINAEDVLPACSLMIYHRADGGDVPTHMPPVNLLQLINKANTDIQDSSIELKLEKGRYDVKVKDCPGYAYEADNWQISDTNRKWLIEFCGMADMVKILIYGGTSVSMGCTDEPERRPSGLFRLCKASFPAGSGPIVLRMCKGGRAQSVSLGNGLIDPDGYVYNAALGLPAKIQGARVTCDAYDDETAIWSRWPAELFESQVNPQTTAADGYYAFFVPPGFYRINATASNYQPHTSPVIQVIDEIVHYNAPLEPRGGIIWLPFVGWE